MKRTFILLTTILLALCFGCSAPASTGVSQEAYNTVVAERDALKAELAQLKASMPDDSSAKADDAQKPAAPTAEPTVEPTSKPTVEPITEPTQDSSSSKPTTGQRNALRQAESYLSFMSFSYSGLISQLEYEGFSREESVYAVDNCGADWNEQAAKKAKDYLNMMGFSRSSLISQLEYEGFTSEQAAYGAAANGY